VSEKNTSPNNTLIDTNKQWEKNLGEFGGLCARKLSIEQAIGNCVSQIQNKTESWDVNKTSVHSYITLHWDLVNLI
jgi:hypothetical protein